MLYVGIDVHKRYLTLCVNGRSRTGSFGANPCTSCSKPRCTGRGFTMCSSGRVQRRSQRGNRLTWERFGAYLKAHPLPPPRICVQIWDRAP